MPIFHRTCLAIVRNTATAKLKDAQLGPPSSHSLGCRGQTINQGVWLVEGPLMSIYSRSRHLDRCCNSQPNVGLFVTRTYRLSSTRLSVDTLDIRPRGRMMLAFQLESAADEILDNDAVCQRSYRAKERQPVTCKFPWLLIRSATSPT
jgi:hypothetical protein